MNKHKTENAIKIVSKFSERPSFFNKNIQIDQQNVGKSFMPWLKNGVFLIHDILYEKGAVLKLASLENLLRFKL